MKRATVVAQDPRHRRAPTNDLADAVGRQRPVAAEPDVGQAVSAVLVADPHVPVDRLARLRGVENRPRLRPLARDAYGLLVEVDRVEGHARHLGAAASRVDHDPEDGAVASLAECRPLADLEQRGNLIVRDHLGHRLGHLRVLHPAERVARDLLLLKQPLEEHAERREPDGCRRGREARPLILDERLQVSAPDLVGLAREPLCRGEPVELEDRADVDLDRRR